MLVLSRKQNEEIVIGNNVCIKVVGIFGNKVRLGISAPADVAIRRGELDFFQQSSDSLPGSNRPGLKLPGAKYAETIDFDIPKGENCLAEHV